MLSLLTPEVITVLGGLGAIVAAVVTAFFRGRKSGKREEQRKNVERERKAQEARDAMQQGRKKHQQELAGQTDEEARQEAEKWVRN